MCKSTFRQNFLPQFHLSLLGSLESYERGGAWRRKWKRLKIRGDAQGSHNKTIGCGASGAHAPGTDDEEENVKTRSGIQNRRLRAKLYKDFGDRTGGKILEFLFVLPFLYTVMLRNKSGQMRERLHDVCLSLITL
jgi:hypothetical protein